MSGRRWKSILAVMERDLLEFVRDRRTLFVTLLMPMAMYPVLAMASTLGLRTALADLEARSAPQPLTLVLSGPDAIRFAARLREIVPAGEPPPPDWPARTSIEMAAPSVARQLIDAAEADAWIDLPPGALAALDGRGTLALEARLSTVRPPNARRQRHLAAVIEAVAEDARRRRLADTGLPASLLEPVTLDVTGGVTAGRESLEGILPTAAGGVLVLLALLTATGAFYPAIDAIAGEKERGTIETLLIAPASTGDIVTGKFLAVWGVTLATLLVNAISIAATAAVLVRLLPDAFALEIDLPRIAVASAVTLVAFTGLAAVAAATCLAVTSGSRSGKEAQNTLTPIILLASGLASSALLPGGGGPLVAVAPFAGQVSLAKAAIEGGSVGGLAGRLALSLLGSALATWLVLRGATAALADEESLFRGPDSARGLFARPAPRPRPTPMQGFAALVVALAALWYAQGIAPGDLTLAVPLQQAALVLPLAAMLAWQRVDRRGTFGLFPPGGRRWPLGVAGAVLAGAGLFVVSASATLALRGTQFSEAARDLALRIMDLLQTRPWWVSLALVAVLPAVCEEVFFRGWLLAALAGERPRRRRAVAAVLLQAAAFAAFHLLPERMPQTFVLGAVLGWLTLATGSLLPAVLAHAAHNAVPLALVALAAEGQGTRLVAGDTTSLPGWLVASAALAMAVGLGLVLACRRTGPAGG